MRSMSCVVCAPQGMVAKADATELNRKQSLQKRPLKLIDDCLACGFFFFQAEDGIRDVAVTGVQTCALPIFSFGAKILDPLAPLARIREMVLYHHEFYDGSGYPQALAGEHIPIGARIIAIAEIGRASCRERV